MRTPREDTATVVVGGHRLRLTHLDKVLYPETGTTKRDVLDYYARIAPHLVAHARGRPVTRKRWVDGVGTEQHPGNMFFQKDLDESTPSWITRRSIRHRDHTNDYPLLGDEATLAWFAQISALELHVPQWRFGPTGAPRNPDRFVLDLDPGPGAGLPECVAVAGWAREILDDLGLDPRPVTSGSTGIHLYGSLDGSQTSDQVNAVAHELARALEADHPDLVVSDMARSRRAGRVLVDWSQNNGAKTTIAPYSLRGRSRPTVAAPRTWRELARSDLRQLEFGEVLERVRRRGDPMSGLGEADGAALEPTADRMAGFEPSPAARDRLEIYRSRRDAAKTPEPVPTASSAPGDGQSFVIQEHHAGRLHWDFRLEHDGVLVSWALPKGVPHDPSVNHLAVQTEDHPLEYGTFEGEIPRGEYGAGTVTIWDAGTIEIEKWRDGQEIIATLTGRRGIHRYALIHTRENQWLIHLMTDDRHPVRPTERPRPQRRRHREPTMSPMLATLGTAETLDTADEWSYEMKWDGIRCIVTVHDGALQLSSRTGRDVTASYPELAAVVDAVDGDAVLDGEIIAPDRSGRPDFGRLQSRMGLEKPREVERARRETPVRLVVFDLLEHNGRSLLHDDYDERRAALETTVTAAGPVDVPPAFDGDLEAAITASRELRLEGVMAKRRDSTYQPGRRARSWIKIKHHLAQEVVVIGWRDGRGSRSGTLGSLLLAVPDDGALRYAGRVGTGFRESDLRMLHTRLARMTRVTPPVDDVPSADAVDAHWVTPRLVAEVEFAEWTSTGRLRQPTWRGLRPDKDPTELRRETPGR